MHRRMIIFTLCFLLAGEALAIVPPRVDGVKIPEEMRRNILKNPATYMPGIALSERMALYREQKQQQGLYKPAAPDTLLAYVPVLCLQYADVEPEWETSQMANQLFDTYANWPTGSMTDYYEEISYGQFSVTGTVYGWYQVSGNTQYYHRENEHTYELIIEGLEMSDPEVDYGQYDNDGPDGIPNSGDDDGVVDQLVVIHSGTGGEYGGPEIWSHSWRLSGAGSGAYTTDDSAAGGGMISVNGYVIQPAVDNVGEMEGIGVFCHEFGHALGLPDLYDRTGAEDGPDYEESEGIGNWGLMAAGGIESSRPSHMCAWSKEVMGWVTPIVLTENLYNETIPAVEDTPVVYKLWTKGDIQPYQYRRGSLRADIGYEYFLVENRQQKRFDDNLPGEGLLIYHVQNSVTTQNDDENNKLVDLEAADNTFELDAGRNRGDRGDPFPGSTDNRNFNRTSQPNSHIHNDGISKVAVENISDPGNQMYADLSVIANDLMYQSNQVHDEEGDGNGFADPGESPEISLQFTNWGAHIPEFTFHLSSDDPAVTILDSVTTYTDIGEDQTVESSEDLFRIRIAEDASYHPLRFTVTGTDGGFHTEEYEIVVMMENLYILLVDDTEESVDDHDRYIIDYYRSAMDLAGIPYYSRWNVEQNGSPPREEIEEYRTIFWVAGGSGPVFTAEEQSYIRDFLNDGGSLLLSGQDIGYHLVENGSEEDSLFYADVLKAEYLANGPDIPGSPPNILMKGISGEPISKNFQPYFFLSGGNSANNQYSPDLIAPLNGATGAMEFFGTGLMEVNSGIKYSGEYRVVYYSFGLEGINELNTGNISRASLIKRSIGWLQEDPRYTGIRAEDTPDLPKSFVLKQNFPNPFNGTTTIPYRLPNGGTVSVRLFDLSGREILSLQRIHQTGGEYEFHWDGTDALNRQVGSGVYFYSLNFQGSRQTKKLLYLK